MPRKPKVFAWTDGFHRYVVAATSRVKALEAWGFDRDLFREGAAEEIADGAGYDQALAEPGRVVELDASAGVKAAAAKPPKKRAETAAQRRKRERKKALEAELAQLEQQAQARYDALQKKRDALKAEQEKVQATLEAGRKGLKAQIAELG